MDKITARNEALAGKIASVFKRRNKMSATAQPPPYILDRHCRFERLISVATITLLLLLSIPALALKAYSYSFIESNVEMGFYLVDEQTGETQTNALVAALPLNIFRVPEKLVLVVSMVSILLSIIHLAFIAWDWKTCLRVSYLHTWQRESRADNHSDPNQRFPSEHLDLALHQRDPSPYRSHCPLRFSQDLVDFSTRLNPPRT